MRAGRRNIDVWRRGQYGVSGGPAVAMLDGLISLTRASVGWQWTQAFTDGTPGFGSFAAINTLRINNRGVRDAIFLEGPTTNLRTQSRAMDNAAWTAGASSTTTANIGNGIDGTAVADRVQCSSGGISRYYTAAHSGYLTYSCHLRANASTSPYRANNFIGGNVVSVQGTVGTTYEHVSVSRFNGSSLTTFCVPADNANGGVAAASDCWYDMHQVEALAFATSPMATVAATVTRSRDEATIASASVPQWMRDGRMQFTISMRQTAAEMVNHATEMTLFAFGTGTDDRIALVVDGGAIKLRVVESGATKVTSGALTWSRWQDITITLDAIGGYVVISGATTGNGSTGGDPWAMQTGDVYVGNVSTWATPYYGEILPTITQVAEASFEPSIYVDTVLDLDFARTDLMVLSGSNVTSIACARRGTVCTTGAAKPVYNATVLNGENAAVTMGADGITCPIGTLLTGQSGFTVFVVAKDTTTARSYALEYGTDGEGTIGQWALIANDSAAGDVAFYAPGSAGDNAWRSAAAACDFVTPRIVSARVDFTRATNEIDALRANAGDLAGSYLVNTDSSGTTLGSHDLVVGVAWGIIARVIVVRGAVSDSVRAQFESYLASEYGLPSDADMATRRTPVLVLMGQSNAQDYTGAVTAVTRNWLGPHDHPSVRAYRHSIIGGSDVTETWQGANGRQYGIVDTYGWPGQDLACLLTLVRHHGLAPRLIEASTEGSTSLATDWDPPSGPNYTGAVSDIGTAIADESPASPEYVIVWIQGESDAANGGTDTSNYGTNLAAFFTALESDVADLAGAKIVIAALNSNYTGATAPNIATVRAAQAAFVAADATNRALVETSDLSTYDGVHYTEASKIILGQRIAAAIAELL